MCIIAHKDRLIKLSINLINVSHKLEFFLCMKTRLISVKGIDKNWKAAQTLLHVPVTSSVYFTNMVYTNPNMNKQLHLM